MKHNKILILTYYWPPASGPAVNRMLSWVKYLTSVNYDVHILTVSNPNNLAEDDSLLSEIPENVHVHKSKTYEPFGIYNKLRGKGKDEKTVGLPSGKSSLFGKLSLFIRLNLFIPDPRIGWKFTAIKKATKLIKEHDISVLISTSPPHSTQLIASSIKKKTGVTWFADLRDPWTKLYHYDNNQKLEFSKRRELRLEQRILSSADKIITVGKQLATDFAKLSGSAEVIYNGFPNKSYNPVRENSETFRINYVGNISANEVEHRIWSALEMFKKELIDSKMTLGFTGKVHADLQSKIENHQLTDIVTFHGYQSHKFALNKIWNSDLLILIIPRAKENRYIITSKIFEYLNSSIPILGVGPVKGEAAEILNKTSYSQMFDYDDLSGILEFIRTVHDNRPKPSEGDIQYIESFSRQKQAEKLSELLDDT